MRNRTLIGLAVGLWMCVVLLYTNILPSVFDGEKSLEIQVLHLQDQLQSVHQERNELLKLIAGFRNNRTSVLCPQNVVVHLPQQETLQLTQQETVQLPEQETVQVPQQETVQLPQQETVQLPQQDTVQLPQTRSNVSRNELAQKQESSSNMLTYEMEYARRKAENTARELWYFLDSVLNKSDTDEGHTPLKISELRESLQGYKRTLFGDFEKLRTANKADVYRKQRLQELGDLIQRRLEYLQNPTDCETAKKLFCSLTKSCGFACQMHHIVHCMISAYALGRTLVLKSDWSMYGAQSFETVFEPISRTCLVTPFKENITDWPAALEYMSRDNTIYLRSEENYSPQQPAFLPPAVPADMAQELSILHGNPSAWWIGQMFRFIFRLKPNLLEEVISRGEKAGFTNTIVGVHIRRTDKILTEAASHPVEEYMYHVKEYYDQVERTQPGISRRVYLATDEPEVLSEARKKYPTYTFINDFNSTRSATMTERNSRQSLHGVISDVYYLARCDYLVCTFSSNLCRIAYELMQTLHGDASGNFRSLDDNYYFHGHNAHGLTAVEAYRSNREGHIALKPGDVIYVAGNHWNGFSMGTNQRTSQKGLFPSYKVEDTVVAADMPIYPQVPLKLTDRMEFKNVSLTRNVETVRSSEKLNSQRQQADASL